MTSATVQFDEVFVKKLARLVGEEMGYAPRYVSSKKLCQHMGITPRRLENWRARGLPSLRVDAHLVYDLEAVRRWVESQA